MDQHEIDLLEKYAPTDPELKSRDRVVKKSEKNSLYAAMDIAAIWLERALAGKEK